MLKIRNSFTLKANKFIFGKAYVSYDQEKRIELKRTCTHVHETDSTKYELKESFLRNFKDFLDIKCLLITFR